ncbi:MAG: T9SS type A sorting domain-containing protein [Bacteroidetes bacterium]|nr:T9SS type A sorting domain-containing protein [Bacteroidota bacterium]
MKTLLILIALISFVSLSTSAQSYCSITTALAYTMDMPGITNFQLNTIDRTSAAIECGGTGCNSYVNTGESTELELGQTYTFSLTHTRDAMNFPAVENNIRIWIDYNNNGTLDDAGETVVLMDLETFGTTTGSFTVPLTATLGITGMRITAKMSIGGGHSLPTACDIPADPLGYHGEFEDYTVNIMATPSGIDENSIGNAVSVFPNPTSGIINIESEARISIIEITNLLGAKVYSSKINDRNAEIDLSNQPRGIYFYTLINERNIITRGKVMVD